MSVWLLTEEQLNIQMFGLWTFSNLLYHFIDQIINYTDINWYPK